MSAHTTPTWTTAQPADVPKSALVLFSGGQDSTTCLAWALSRFDRVETLAFDYGQRHNVELECRKTVLSELRAQFPHWAPKLGEDHKLDIPVLGQVSGDDPKTQCWCCAWLNQHDVDWGYCHDERQED